MPLKKWLNRGITPTKSEPLDDAVSSPPVPLDLAEIRSAEGAFLTYMGYRRKQLESQLGRTSTMALRVLPLLLHCNQPGVPGYIQDKRCPTGIGNYQPTDAELRLARSFFTAPLRRVGVFRPFVEIVAAMGSVGTIAFARDSDLDIWVCYDEFVADAEKLGMFEQKVREVESWLSEVTGRSCCLFLQSSRSVRENRFGETSAEGCGSAMGLILKEEFYRTHIHLAGRYPFWWLSEPDIKPPAYLRFVRFMLMDESFRANQYVDLGAASSPTLEEFFGAAIWQIVKAWRSPLKSVLKMALLQRSIQTGETSTPLCEKLKRTILQGEKVDPYRLLFEEALAGCDVLRKSATAQLLGTCFYLKSSTKLDPVALEKKAKLTENQAILQQFADSWGWDARVVRRLNNFHQWKYEDVSALNREINEYLITTYGEIRTILQDRVQELSISSRDLTVLGRKLHSIYGVAPGKVGVMPILSGGLEEDYLSLHQLKREDGSEHWGLFRGLVKHWELGRRGESMLRSHDDPLELLTWATRNGLMSSRTRLLGRSPNRFLSPTYMDNVARSLTQFFEGCEQTQVSTEDLLRPACVHRLLVMPNFGREDEEIGEIAAVYWNSWGETYYRKWQGPDCFRDFVAEVFAPYLLESPCPENVLLLMPAREVGLLRWSHWRIQFDFPTMAAFLGGRERAAGVTLRHLGQKGKEFFSLTRSGSRVDYQVYAHARDLLDSLCGKDCCRVRTRVEARAGILAIIKAVVDSSREGKVDIFHLNRRGREWVFVHDEIGNVVDFSSHSHGKYFLLARLLAFLRRVYPEVSAQPESPLRGRSLEDVLRIHALHYDETCTAVVATQEYLAAVASMGLEPSPLGVEQAKVSGGHEADTVLTWQGRTFRRPQHANPFAAVAHEVRESRSPGPDYPLHLTDLAPLWLEPSPAAGYTGLGVLLNRKRDLENVLTHSAS